MASASDNRLVMIRLVEAFTKGDIPTVQSLISEDAVWHVPGRSSLAGSHTGHAEILGFFGRIMELSGGTFSVARQDTLSSDSHAMNWDIATAQKPGMHLSTQLALLTRIRDGRIVEASDLIVDQDAWDSFFQ